jgi:NADPH:quinone reductase-like Zn-dependent oxidoreductase
MKAIVQDTYGASETLAFRADIDAPTIAADEVLVRVHAAALDRGTWHLMTGEPYLMRAMGFGLRAPKNRVPGLDTAGTVLAIGADVTRFAVGDEVFGISAGSFAEYAAAREDKLAHKPVNLAFAQAAAMGVSALTARQAVQDVAQVTAGQSVLVVGASGGVGSYAVQIAVAAGARVTGVCSPSKADLVAELGAERVIDYTTDDFADGAQHYDVVLDIGGMTSVSRLRRALTPTGTLVIVGGEGGRRWSPGLGRQLWALALSPFVAQRLAMVICKEHFSGVELLAELAATGQITPAVERTYPLDQVPDAMRHLESGQVRGKVVIAVMHADEAVVSSASREADAGRS